MNDLKNIDTGLHLEGLFGSFLALATAVTARIAETEPEMHRKAVAVIGSGAGALEGRITVEPEPMLILLVRLHTGEALELGKIRIPSLTQATH